MIGIQSLQGSSVSKKSQIIGSLFSIHLLEDDQGHVTVVAEQLGDGVNSDHLGHYLLSRLCEIEMREPKMMTVQMPLYSEHRH